MKTLKYIIPTLLASSVLITTLSAQDSISGRNITVEREYQPIIKDAGKITSTPGVLEPSVEKTKASYSEFNLPLNADFNIHTLEPAALILDKQRDPKSGFARVGLGNHTNTLLDFAAPIINKSDMRLDFSLNHYGTFGDKAHSVTKSALAFDKYFSSFNLYAGIGAGHEYLKYYGNEFNTDSITDFDITAALYGRSTYLEEDLSSINRTAQIQTLTDLADNRDSETFRRFNSYIGIKSLPLTKGIRYKSDVEYKIFDTQDGLQEHQIKSHAGFNSQREKNRAGLDLDLYNLMYNSSNPTLLNFWDSYSVLTMNPYYSIEKNNFNLRLGAKSSFSFIHGRPFNPSADISTEWKLIPKYFSIYGGITGGYDVNTMDDMFKENRYLYADVRVKDTYTPYDFYAGIKVKPIYNLLIDAYVDFKQIDNQYFFVNKEYKLQTPSPSSLDAANDTIFSNRFNVIYSGATLLKIGVRANYNLRNRLNIHFKGAYNKWDVSSEEFAWNKPKWEADFSTNFRVNSDLSLDANLFVDGERYAKLGNQAIRMRPKVDINLGASYSYNNWFTVFAKVNNLINNPYQDFYGYDVQGFNVMAGAAFTF